MYNLLGVVIFTYCPASPTPAIGMPAPCSPNSLRVFFPSSVIGSQNLRLQLFLLRQMHQYHRMNRLRQMGHIFGKQEHRVHHPHHANLARRTWSWLNSDGQKWERGRSTTPLTATKLLHATQ